jgi:hypothetical protein
LKPLFSQLATVLYLTSLDDYFAFVADEAMLHLIGSRLAFGIPFYGQPISCCNALKQFGNIVCGAISGSLAICSLFTGIKERVIKLIDGVKPSKLPITRVWGFIVICG